MEMERNGSEESKRASQRNGEERKLYGSEKCVNGRVTDKGRNGSEERKMNGQEKCEKKRS